MPRPKVLLLSALLIVSCGWLYSSFTPTHTTVKHITGTPIADRNELRTKILSKAQEAKSFVEKNSFNESVCFLVDMKLPSGQNRFFVYDLKSDTVRQSGLVAHGSCNENWLEGRKYGNSVGCGCTSLGKYRIGNSYNGKFGLAFKLYGLDKTNDNAFARFVVLHSHSCIPAVETGEDICQSEGCPMVAPSFLLQLKQVINTSGKPILLWIYE